MRPPLIQGGTRTPQRGHQNKVYVMRYAWLVLSPVLSTARRRTLRNSENLLRVLSTTSGGYNSLCFPASQSYVKVVTKHSHTEVGISTSSQRLKEKTYEGDGYRKGNEGLGSRGDAEQRAGYGNGELQRRAGKSRHHAGRRWTKAIVAGQTGPVLGKQTDGNRRTVRRDQGTRCRLLDLAGSVDGRGHPSPCQPTTVRKDVNVPLVGWPPVGPMYFVLLAFMPRVCPITTTPASASLPRVRPPFLPHLIVVVWRLRECGGFRRCGVKCCRPPAVLASTDSLVS